MRRAFALMLGLALMACADDGVYRASNDAREMANVIPRGDGVYDVVARWRERTVAERWALEMARETCAERGQDFAVTAEQVAYDGLVPEQVLNAMRS